jgi:hypothetical protein
MTQKEGGVMQRSLPMLIAVAATLVTGSAAAAPAGVIREFRILSTTPAFGGATLPGAAGPYEVIAGTVHGELNPSDPANAAIADLKLAPVGPDGAIAYSTDVVILRPVRAANATRVLFYDVVNRGQKLAIRRFIGGDGLAGSPPPATFPSLLRLGATIVWRGWQGDLPQTTRRQFPSPTGITLQGRLARPPWCSARRSRCPVRAASRSRPTPAPSTASSIALAIRG